MYRVTHHSENRIYFQCQKKISKQGLNINGIQIGKFREEGNDATKCQIFMCWTLSRDFSQIYFCIPPARTDLRLRSPLVKYRNECVLILIRNTVLSASGRGEAEDSMQGWKTVPLGPHLTFGKKTHTHPFSSTLLGSILEGLRIKLTKGRLALIHRCTR